MKTFIFLLVIFILSACASQRINTVEEQVNACKKGYLMALKSDVSDLTENVIFEIILKRMNGLLNDSKEIELALSQLMIEGQDESIRRKAFLALSYLSCKDEVCKVEIKAGYHDPDKLFNLLNSNLSNNSEIRFSGQ